MIYLGSIMVFRREKYRLVSLIDPRALTISNGIDQNGASAKTIEFS